MSHHQPIDPIDPIAAMRIRLIARAKARAFYVQLATTAAQAFIAITALTYLALLYLLPLIR